MAAFTSIALGVGALAGAAGTTAGAIVQGDAAGAAGRAQAGAARDRVALEREMLDKQLAERQRIEQVGIALGEKYGAMSPGEIRSINSLIQTKEQSVSAGLAKIASMERALETIDPVVRESGKQVLELLQGKDSALLAPLRKERERQRTKMEGELASRLGPGWRTSSAGLEGMLRYDDQTASLMANAQLQTFNTVASQFGNLFSQQLAGTSDVTRQTGSIYQTALGADQAVGGLEQGAQNRLAGSVLSGFRQAPVDFSQPGQAAGQLTQVAGAPYAGGAQTGQTIGSIGGTIAGQAIGGAMQNNMYANILDRTGQQVRPTAPTYQPMFQTGSTGGSAGGPSLGADTRLFPG